MSFIKQCKGFDSDKVSLPTNWSDWLWSIKYDGHYISLDYKGFSRLFIVSIIYLQMALNTIYVHNDLNLAGNNY